MTTSRFSFSLWQVLTLNAILLLAGSAFAETVIYSFQGTPDGANSYGSLVAGKHGVLYGTTPYGGQNDAGAIFELTPPATKGDAWTEAILYSFAGGAGAYDPQPGLIFDRDGNLYGTAAGGAHGAGCIFELTPPTTEGGSWTEQVIYSFLGDHTASDGVGPAGELSFGWQGSLYGTAFQGGEYGVGVVFRLTQVRPGVWDEGVIHSFSEDGEDGFTPVAGVIADKTGNLYGTTYEGGGPCIDDGCGTIFELSPPTVPGAGWTETVLFSFTGASGDGANPWAPLIFDSAGNLYGTTTEGGQGEKGTVFELSPKGSGEWTESVLYEFTGGSDGDHPWAGLALDAIGNLYGTAYEGGRFPAHGCSNGCGTVFELSPPTTAGGTWTETTLHEFRTGYETSIDGIGPYGGGLALGLSGSLYGATPYGGTNGSGAVFSVHP